MQIAAILSAGGKDQAPQCLPAKLIYHISSSSAPGNQASTALKMLENTETWLYRSRPSMVLIQFSGICFSSLSQGLQSRSGDHPTYISTPWG
jgi:hypothetical protein